MGQDFLNRQYMIVYLDPFVDFLDIVVVLEALDGRPLPRVLLRQRPRWTEVQGEQTLWRKGGTGLSTS